MLGLNRAGKTTTVNVLTCLEGPDGGTVRIAGHDIATDITAVRQVGRVNCQTAAVICCERASHTVVR